MASTFPSPQLRGSATALLVAAVPALAAWSSGTSSAAAHHPTLPPLPTGAASTRRAMSTSGGAVLHTLTLDAKIAPNYADHWKLTGR